jgi:uncharacterized caspase-like protein
MEEGVTRLKNRLTAARGSYGFFYYSGHAVQSGGINYLIPVDANIQSENFLRQRAVSVQALLDELNDAGNELNMVALDAGRDNPFSWSGTRSLQVVSHNQPAKCIIVYATSAGSTAEGGEGRNGLFTTHILNNLKKPGLEVNEVFRLTGADVYRASRGAQVPAIYSQFFEVAYLGTRPSAVVPVPKPSPAPGITTDAKTYYDRGLVYYHKKDYNRAIAEFTQAIRLDPNYADAYTSRGVAYADKGEYDRP